MKKKIKMVVVIIALLFVGFIVIGSIGSDSDNNSTPTKKEETVKEGNITEATAEHSVKSSKEVIADEYNIDAIPDGSKDYGEYLHLGGSYTNVDGDINIEVIDVDYKTDGNIMGEYSYASTEVYIAIEITNNSNTDLYFDQSNAALFIDDYEVKEGMTDFYQENGYIIVNNTKQYPTVANISSGGRKGTIVFVTTISSKSGVTETSDIDFEICGLVFKINPRFILNQFAEVMEELTPEEPPARTELDGKAIIEAKSGAYVSSDSGITITIEGDILTAYNRSGKNDFDDRFVTKEEVPNYFISSGRGLTITFYEGGLFIEADPEDDMFGDLDGLYSISDDIITDDAVESDTTSSEGIGNPVIDANPNRYMPEGITGTIDNEYGVFCSNKPTKDIIPGEYLIVGGGTSVVNISEDYKFSLKFINGDIVIEGADMVQVRNTDECAFLIFDDNDRGYTVSFYEGGLYLYTDLQDDENDWVEGFYELW